MLTIRSLTVMLTPALAVALSTGGRAGSSFESAAPAIPQFSLVGAAYDERHSRLVVVGGPADSSTAAVETWEWNGSVWAKAAVSGPSRRDEPLLAYDRAHGLVLLHGGYRGSEMMNDTWTWDGAQWRRVATDGPSPRGAAAMTYDSRRNRIVMFGGSSGPMGSPLHNDLWEWDGNRWTRLVSDGADGSPPARALHAMAYDERRGRLVVAGGFSVVNGEPRPFNDTWEWDGSAWHKVGVPGPGARDHLAMVYAPDRGVIVMHGGGNPDTGLTGDTWLYDGASWTKLLDDGPARGRHRIVYDRREKAVVLFGGWGPKQQMNETWILDGRAWTRQSPPALSASAACASKEIGARTGHSLAYDPVARRVMMFGGSSGDSADPLPRSLWAWDGRAWNCISPSGPSGRRDAFLAFDAARNRLVLFGGRVVGATPDDMRFLTDTWEWNGSAWLLADTAGPGPRIHGAIAYDPRRHAVVLQGGAGASGLLDDTWEWTGTKWRAVALHVPAGGIANSLMSTSRGLAVLIGSPDGAPECARLRRAVVFDVTGDSMTRRGQPGPCFSPQTPATAIANGVVLYSGWNPNQVAESWTFDGDSWSKTQTAPPRRRGAQAAYDETRHCVVLFGGDGENGLLEDTWEWDGTIWRRAS